MYYTVLQTRGPRAHSPLQLAFMHGSQATGTFWTIGQRSTLGNCIPQGTALSFGSELHSEIPCICIQRSRILVQGALYSTVAEVYQYVYPAMV